VGHGGANVRSLVQIGPSSGGLQPLARNPVLTNHIELSVRQIWGRNYSPAVEITVDDLINGDFTPVLQGK